MIMFVLFFVIIIYPSLNYFLLCKITVRNTALMYVVNLTWLENHVAELCYIAFFY